MRIGVIAALAGMLGLVLWVAFPLPDVARPGLVTLVILGVLCVGLMAMVADRAVRTVLRDPAILVPVASAVVVAVALSAVLNALFSPVLVAAARGDVASPWQGLVLLAHVGLMMLALDVVAGAWLTRIAGEVGAGADAHPLDALTAVAPRLGRVFLFRLIGLAPLAFVLPVLAARTGPATLVAAALLVGGCFIWNLATTAVVPVLVDTPGPLGSVLLEGLTRSWAARARLWPLVLVQMLLFAGLGLVRLSYAPDIAVAEVVRRWAFDFALKGGHAAGSQWYDTVEGLSLLPHLPLANLLSWGVVGVVAALARLHTYRVLRES